MSFFSTAVNFLALPFARVSYRNDLRRTLLALSADAALVVVMLVGVMLATVLPNLPAFDVVTDYHPKIPLRIYTCLLYTSPSPRDRTRSRMPSSA